MSSAYTLSAAQGAATVWVRKDAQGNVVTHEQTQDERMAHVVPPRGEYTLIVRSFAEPFEMARAEQFGGGMQTMTRLELEIADGRGKGKTCVLLCGWSIGPRSNLGKVYRAVTGKAVDNGGEYDVAEILGGRFVAYLQPSDALDDNGKPRGTRCSWDTVAPVGEAAATNGSGDDDGLWS